MKINRQRLLALCFGIGVAALGLSAGPVERTDVDAAEREEVAAGEREPDSLPKREKVSVRNAFFDVYAGDILSAQYVATAGGLFAERFSEVLRPPGNSPNPVLVNLIPAAEANWPQGIPRTRYFATGYVEVNLPWGAEVTREQVERAVAQGHLTALSGAYGKGEVHVPLWLEVAGQHLARAVAKPSHGDTLARRIAARARPMALGEILGAKRGEELDPDFAAHAYWLFLFLEREGRASGQTRNFLVRVLRGEEGLPALAATLGSQVRSREEAHVWWVVGLKELTRPKGGPVSSVAESRQRVEELSRFTFSAGGSGRRLLVEELWQHRESATLRGEVARRLQLVQIELAAVHPFYHNALLSLGRVLEAVGRGAEEDYRAAAVAFRHDQRTGDELAADTREVLDDLSRELKEF